MQVTKEFLEMACERDYRPPTKSQRLRFVLYRLWERSGSQQPFEEWYAERMDRIIGRFESLLTNAH
jgi:hypothetical protein